VCFEVVLLVLEIEPISIDLLLDRLPWNGLILLKGKFQLDYYSLSTISLIATHSGYKVGGP